MKLLPEIDWKDVPGDKTFATIDGHLHRFGLGLNRNAELIGHPAPSDNCDAIGVLSKEKINALGFTSSQDPSFKEMIIDEVKSEITKEQNAQYKQNRSYLSGAFLLFNHEFTCYPFYGPFPSGWINGTDDTTSSISTASYRQVEPKLPNVNHVQKQKETKADAAKNQEDAKKSDSSTHNQTAEDRQQTVRRQAQVQIQAEDDKDEDDKKQEERRLWYRKQLRLWQQKNNEREP